MYPAKENIWFQAEEIPQNNQFMMQITEVFCNDWPKLGYGDKITKYFTHFVGDNARMYFIRKEFDKNAKYLTNKMLDDPEWAIEQNNKFKEYADQYFNCTEKFLKIDLTQLNNKELIGLLLSCRESHFLSHGVAGSLTWQADADQERFTRAAIEMVEARIKQKKISLNSQIIFPILTTPAQDSFINKEEKDFLKIAIKIYNLNQIKSVFIDYDADKVISELERVDKKIYQEILDHYKNYCWLLYQYKGPATDINYYLERWQALIKSDTNPEKLLNKTISDKKLKLDEQKILIDKLDFTDEQLNIIKLSQYLIYLKDYRKAILFHGLYCSEKILKEIANRLYLSLDQIRAMGYKEIKDALIDKKFNINELNERLKECIHYYEKSRYEIYTGEKLKSFLENLQKEKVVTKNLTELKGTIACQGKIKGVVKVINVPEEMDKMQVGNIMVSRTTNPNLVPAMKKAGGLVSQDGGLTCHTAIVAREMNKPCLVGVKNVLQNLKDNDVVELDSEGGRIKILKK